MVAEWMDWVLTLQHGEYEFEPQLRRQSLCMDLEQVLRAQLLSAFDVLVYGRMRIYKLWKDDNISVAIVISVQNRSHRIHHPWTVSIHQLLMTDGI